MSSLVYQYLDSILLWSGIKSLCLYNDTSDRILVLMVILDEEDDDDELFALLYQ